MKSNTNKEQIREVEAAVAEVQRLSAAVAEEAAAPQKLRSQRDSELRRLRAEHEAEVLDPDAPDANTKFASRGLRLAKIEALARFLKTTPNQSETRCALGPVLFEAVGNLQKAVWDIAEPIEVAGALARRAGLNIVSLDEASPRFVAGRLMGYCQNFLLDGSRMAVLLARSVLRRRMPPALPQDMGTEWRTLRPEEIAFLEGVAA